MIKWDKSHFSPGIQVLIKIPSKLPSWVGLDWADYLQKCNGKVGKVTSHPKKGKDYFWVEPAIQELYFISLEDFFQGQCSIFCFAIEWLSPLTAHYKTPCDCPLPVLMNRGCQNSGHQ